MLLHLAFAGTARVSRLAVAACEIIPEVARPRAGFLRHALEQHKSHGYTAARNSYVDLRDAM